MYLGVRMAAHIIAIDDDPNILEIYRRALIAEGYHVTSFVDPAEALSMVAQLRPDLIILDWIFHRDTVALETLRGLLASPAAARTRLLVITGAIHHVQGLRAELIAQNIPILYKPFSLDELLAAVRRLVPAQGCSSSES